MKRCTEIANIIVYRNLKYTISYIVNWTWNGPQVVLDVWEMVASIYIIKKVYRCVTYLQYRCSIFFSYNNELQNIYILRLFTFIQIPHFTWCCNMCDLYICYIKDLLSHRHTLVHLASFMLYWWKKIPSNLVVIQWIKADGHGFNQYAS